MSAKERIGKLEALLARIHANASAPRGATMTAIPTVPPSAEAREALRSESSEFEAATDQEHGVVPEPEESRARLVVAGPTVEVEFEEEEVMELDERNVVSEAEVAEMAVAAPAPAKEEEAPPSSRRPIAEPAESPQEAELPIAASAPLTPPPESGKQVASESLSFDDDFTGVRESAARLQSAPPPEPAIALESLREPSPPPPPDELEA
ncbi:MAG TPA: hypothetical protein VLM85_07380, partial [Polyangiaceae bacterium]|nr:hypothetical protein [Polyangiaceae bacterium]